MSKSIIEKSARELMPTAARIQFAAYQIDASYLEKAFKQMQEVYEFLSIKDSQKVVESLGLFTSASREILVKDFEDVSKLKQANVI